MENQWITKYVKCAMTTVMFVFTGLLMSVEQNKSHLAQNHKEFSLNKKIKNSDTYLRCVKEIVDAYAKEMEKEFGIHCYGSGGSMPNDVESIEVSFISYKKTSIDEARKMEVAGVQKLLHLINNHEKIRPFLREYPFTPSRVGVSISFHNKDNTHFTDGSVALLSLIHGKLYYRAAELRKERFYGVVDLRNVKDKMDIPPHDEIVEKLVFLFDETYEEALSIVQGSKKEKTEETKS